MLLTMGVSVFAQGTSCPKPANLSAALQTDGWGTVSLSWDRPADASSYSVGYVNTASSGLSYGSLNYTAVIRLTSTELAPYHGKYLRAVQFIPYGFADFSVQIWKGGSLNPSDTSFSPGTLVYNKPVTTPLNYITMNTVELDTTFVVDSTQEMWLGIHAVYPSGNFPIAFLTGTAVQFKGNITYFPLTDSWSLLYSTASDGSATFDRNWTILGVFSDSPDIVTGYDLYRDNTLVASLAAGQRSHIDSISPGTYEYGVRATYQNGCVSQPAVTNVTLQDVNCTLTVPYSTSFEEAVATTATTGTNNLPECWQYWNKGGNSYTNHPAVFSAAGYASTGTKYVQFYTRRYVNYAVQYAILPPVDNVNTFVNQLKLAFEARAYAAGNKGRLEVGVMSDYTDASTFELIDTIPVNDINWELHQTDFSGYTGTGRYIAIRCPRPSTTDAADATYRLLIDNVAVGYAIACDAPTGITDTNVTATSIELNWSDDCNGTVTYYIECNNGQTYTSNTNSVIITGLNPSTPYTFTIYSVNAADAISNSSQPYTVSTACGPMTSLPFSDDFDSHPGSTSGTTNNLPDCWFNISTSTSSSYVGYPIIYNSTTYANTESNSLRFYSYASASSNYGTQTAVLPEIDTQTYPMNTLTLSFNARRYSATYSGSLEIGVIQPDSSFVTVGTVSPMSTTYEPFTVSFAGYTGSGNRMAIRLPQPSSSYAGAHVDDIQIIPQSSCPTPNNITVSHIAATSAEVSWEGVTGASAYEVAVVPDGSALANVSPETVNDTTLELTGLSASTGYTVYVRSLCGGTETSFWSSGNAFTTKCVTVAVPYHEDFDTYVALSTSTATTPGTMPDCWTRLNTYTSPYPYVYSTQHYNGTGSLYMYGYSASYSAAVSPALDLSQYGAGELEVSFKMMRTTTYGGRIDVGIIDHFDNDGDLDNVTWLRSVFPHEIANTYEWTNMRIALPGYYSEPQYIVIYAPAPGSSSTNASFIDAFAVDVVSPCETPAGVTVSAIAATSAKVNWKPVDGVTGYTVTYGQEGGTATAVNVEASENSLLLSGLTPDAAYQVSVAALCGSGDGVAETAFRTLCLGMDELSVGSGTSTSTYIPVYAAYQNSFSQQIYTATDMNNTAMEISALAFEYGGTAPMSNDVRIYLGHTFYNNMTEANGWIPMSGSQVVFTGTVTWEEGWNYIVLDTPFQYDGLQNLVVMVDNNTIAGNGTATTGKSFKYHAGTAMSRYVYNGTAATATTDLNPYNLTAAGTVYNYRNNIRFGSCDAQVTCIAPNLFANDNGTSIILNWAPGNGETSWSVEHKISGTANWTSDGTVSTTTYTLENLLASTSYDVRVGTVCSDGTEWATATVQTHCDAAQLPLTENFDAATGTTASDFIPCWYRGTNSTSNQNYAYTTQNTSAPYSMRVCASTSYYSYIVSPRLADDVQMDSLLIKFNMYAANAGYPMQVGIMSNPDDVSTFVPLKTVYQSTGSLSAWTLQEVNTKNYTGNGRHIALLAPQWRTATMYVDDIIIDYMVPCAHVTDFQTDDLQSTQAQISWTAGGSETEWEYVLVEGDSVDWESVTPDFTESNTVLLTGLTPSTTYTLYVKSICDAESESEFFPFPFTTECPPITGPYLQNFDSYGTGTTAWVDCWNRLNTTTTKPYVNSTYHSSGAASLYLPSPSAGQYNVAILPRLDDAVAVNTLQLRMQYRCTTSTYPSFYVGVMTNPADFNTFVPVDTVESTSTTAFQEYVVNFDQYTGSGKYIALMNNTAAARYIDDILLDIIPACENTSVLQVGEVTSNSITAVWTSGTEATGYNVMLVPTGTPYTQGVPVAVAADTTYTFSGLTDNTAYDLYLTWICAGGNSNTIALQGITTECATMLSVPYVETFDSYATGTGTAPDCWRLYGTATTKPYLNTTSYSSPAALYFPSAASGLYNIAVLPRLADNVDANTLQLRCYLRATASSGTLLVGVMTDPLDYSTFVVVDTLENASTTYAEQTVNLSSYTGSGKYIAFVNTFNSARYVDNVSLDIISACENESELAISEITTETATASWTESTLATAYQVAAVPTGTAFSESDLSTVNDTVLALGNLSPNTDYTVYLRYICGNGYSNYVIASFTTACEGIAELPYSENFDSVPGTTASTVNNLPPCWSYWNGGTSYTGYPIVYSSSTYANSGSNSLRFYTYSTTAYSDQFAILPPIDATFYTLSDLKVSFDMRKYSTSYPVAQIVVGVMTNPYDTATFTAVDTIEVSETTYEAQVVFFNEYQGADGRIAFKAPKMSHYNQPVIDNLVVDEASSCKPVTDLALTDIHPDEATVTWTPRGSETSWTIIYQEMYGTEWTETTTGNASATLSGLSPNTLYTVGVSADCDGESSDTVWMTFTTECLPTPIPWTENFDGITGNTSTTSNVLPSCWNYLNEGTNSTYLYFPMVYQSASYANSGSNAVRFYNGSAATCGDEFLILPEVDTVANPINALMVQFQARKYSTSYGFNLVVGVMTDPYDASTFTPVDSLSVSETTYGSNSLYSVYFTGFTGYGNHIALKMPKTSSIQWGYVDDVVLKLAPNCMPVSNLAISDITSSSMTVSWTPGNNESAWILRYRSENETQFTTVSLTDTFYTLNNLAANTSYAFAVQADCGDMVSANSDFVSARTLCDPSDLPFFENFDGIAAGTATSTNNLPDCWNHYNNNAASYAGYPVVYNSSTYANSGTNSLRFYTYTSTSYSDEYAILPEFTTPLNTVKMSFAARCYSTTSTYKLCIVAGVVNGSDINTFQPIDTIEVLGTGYNNYTVFFDQYTGTGGRIALKALQNCGVTYNSGYIDDISVTVNTCALPTQLNTTSLTETTAAVTWMPGGSETSWTLQYKADTADTWSDEIDITGTPTHTLTGLTNGQTYNLRLRSECGTNDFSQWLETSFTQNWQDTTPVTQPTVTTDNPSGIGQTSATLNATVTNPSNVTITGKGFQWKETTGGTYVQVTGTGTGNTFSYSLTDLTANTSYTFRAFITTASDVIYGEEITFTTLEQGVEPCATPTGLTASEVTGESITISWDNDPNVSTWNIHYNPVGGQLSMATSNTNSYTISGLTSNTPYQINVQADCGNGNLSEWSPAITVTTTGIDSWLANSVSLYPNPAKEYVDIRVDGDLNVTMMEVYDVYGKLINAMNVIENPTRINVSNLANGMYFVRVTTEAGMVTKTFVKR